MQASGNRWFTAAAVALARIAMGVTAPAGRRARLTILIHHRVHRVRDPLFPGEPDAEAFDRYLGLVAGLFHVLPLDDAIRRLCDGALPPRPACITFDDGYADNAEVALPILHRRGLVATFFVSSGFLDGGRMWNDTIIESVRGAAGDTLDLAPIGMGTHALGSPAARRAAIDRLLAACKYLSVDERTERCAAIAELVGAALPDGLMLRSDQVRALHAAGMGIGAHTVSHPILTRIPDALARREIAGGRAALESIIGSRVGLFAYPNGKPGIDYAAGHVAIVRALGFDAALSTGWGAANRATDRFQLPRFTPWDRTAPAMALRFVRNLAAPIGVV